MKLLYHIISYDITEEKMHGTAVRKANGFVVQPGETASYHTWYTSLEKIELFAESASFFSRCHQQQQKQQRQQQQTIITTKCLFLSLLPFARRRQPTPTALLSDINSKGSSSSIHQPPRVVKVSRCCLLCTVKCHASTGTPTC